MGYKMKNIKFLLPIISLMGSTTVMASDHDLDAALAASLADTDDHYHGAGAGAGALTPMPEDNDLAAALAESVATHEEGEAHRQWEAMLEIADQRLVEAQTKSDDDLIAATAYLSLIESQEPKRRTAPEGGAGAEASAHTLDDDLDLDLARALELSLQLDTTVSRPTTPIPPLMKTGDDGIEYNIQALISAFESGAMDEDTAPNFEGHKLTLSELTGLLMAHQRAYTPETRANAGGNGKGEDDDPIVAGLKSILDNLKIGEGIVILLSPRMKRDITESIKALEAFMDGEGKIDSNVVALQAYINDSTNALPAMLKAHQGQNRYTKRQVILAVLHQGIAEGGFI